MLLSDEQPLIQDSLRVFARQWLTPDAIQIHGGYGYVSEFAVERICRAARVTHIHAGASDLQCLLIVRTLLCD